MSNVRAEAYEIERQMEAESERRRDEIYAMVGEPSSSQRRASDDDEDYDDF